MRRALSTSVTVTDPLVKYRSLVATGFYSPDAAQHRLAIHLQKVYHRLQDYTPPIEYRQRLQALTDALDQQKKKAEPEAETLAVESHPIWRNPLFARFTKRRESRDSLALTRLLTGHEEAISIDSPRGLFLSGEVGTGKSMLLDLLGEGLPTSRKRRWHFNTFMLHALSQLERHRLSEDPQHSLLWVAKDMIETSPILFLDEFQLPDRAASKILSILLTAFFQLGGVLVASSNRMPDELEKAAGYQYVAAPKVQGRFGRLIGLGRAQGHGELFGASGDFANFLEVLKARCEFWNIESTNDWRKRDMKTETGRDGSVVLGVDGDGGAVRALSGIGADDTDDKAPEHIEGTLPSHYYRINASTAAEWAEAVRAAQPDVGTTTQWATAELVVYGRAINIPRQQNGITFWDFDELMAPFGPADYITMASTYHTFIIDNIPALTILQKNEGRRLITLLDALYESRCKLIIRAAVGPDELFFADIRTGSATKPAQELLESDPVYSETIAEAYQDHTMPFRPNISSYKESGEQDPDHDFSDAESVEVARPKVDFGDSAAFTGEDERFAFRRAASRLWEMCGARWHARTGEWWRPLPVEARHWERGKVATVPRARNDIGVHAGDIRKIASVELDEHAGLQRGEFDAMRKKQLGEVVGR